MPTNPIPRESLERNIEAAAEAKDGFSLSCGCPTCATTRYTLLPRVADPLSGLSALSRRVMELEDGIADALDTLTMPMPAYAEPSGVCVKSADWTGRRDLVRDALKGLLAHAPAQETT